jgi:hypothetical protein
MLPVGFEPTIPASERPQNHDLDRAATGTGATGFTNKNFNVLPTDIIAVFCMDLRKTAIVSRSSLNWFW